MATDIELKSTYFAAASRLLVGASRPLGDLSAVMASPPTITGPASDGANSTIQTGNAPGQSTGMYLPSDATRVALFGGPISGGRIQGLTRVSGSRVQGHSNCIAFMTDSQTVDFALRCNGNRWACYVTDPDGVRRRIAAADRAQAYSNYNYYKLDFGSTAGGGRLVEVYLSDVGNFGGINVATGYSIWPADLGQQPRIAMILDSFGTSMNDTTLQLKLAMPDWFAAFFGCNNPYVNDAGSTGVIGNNAGTYNTFAQRVAAGDLDYARIGNMDLVFAPGSVNDANPTNNGIASPAGDATVQAAYQSYIAALMVAQPNAIIVGAGAEFTNGVGAVSTRTAAYKAGFVAAAGSDPRMLFLDNTLFEYAPDTGVLGADTVHPGGVFGARHIGERLARQILSRVRALAQTA